MPITTRRELLCAMGAGAMAAAIALPLRAQSDKASPRMQSWPLNARQGTGIHDVAPAPDGGVWFSAQASGHLGHFDPKSGRTELVALGARSSPHGVIQGPDKAAWLTDGGQNAIVRVGWPDRAVRVFALPAGAPYANLNTAAFDADGDLWFTGQSGVTGKLAVKTGVVTVKDAPRGRGPYGICATPSGDIWWCSLANSFIARIDRKSGDSIIVEPPTKNQGARRVWSDSRGRIWVSEWNSGNLSMHDPAAKSWRTWKAPGDNPRVYAVYVDERDKVWISEWGGNAMYRFDPGTEKFERFGMARPGTSIRQILGRPGEVWLPESGTEHITVIRTT
jgi:virginiamycin B lyase